MKGNKKMNTFNLRHEHNMEERSMERHYKMENMLNLIAYNVCDLHY